MARLDSRQVDRTDSALTTDSLRVRSTDEVDKEVRGSTLNCPPLGLRSPALSCARMHAHLPGRCKFQSANEVRELN